jgi:hypothetical protein
MRAQATALRGSCWAGTFAQAFTKNNLVGEGELALLYTDGQDTMTGFDPRSQQIMIAP